jgi:hypothetical protein
VAESFQLGDRVIVRRLNGEAKMVGAFIRPANSEGYSMVREDNGLMSMVKTSSLRHEPTQEKGPVAWVPKVGDAVRFKSEFPTGASLVGVTLYVTGERPPVGWELSRDPGGSWSTWGQAKNLEPAPVETGGRALCAPGCHLFDTRSWICSKCGCDESVAHAAYRAKYPAVETGGRADNPTPHHSCVACNCPATVQSEGAWRCSYCHHRRDLSMRGREIIPPNGHVDRLVDRIAAARKQQAREMLDRPMRFGVMKNRDRFGQLIGKTWDSDDVEAI